MATKSKNKVYHLTLRYKVTDIKVLSNKNKNVKTFTTDISLVNEFGRKRRLVGQSKSKEGSLENALSPLGSVQIVKGKKGDRTGVISKGDYIISKMTTTSPVKFLEVYKEYTGNDTAKINEYCSEQGKKIKQGEKLDIHQIGLSSFACRVKTVEDAKREASDFKIEKENKKPASGKRKPKKRKRKPASQTTSTPKPARRGRKPESQSGSKPKPASNRRKLKRTSTSGKKKTGKKTTSAKKTTKKTTKKTAKKTAKKKTSKR